MLDAHAELFSTIHPQPGLRSPLRKALQLAAQHDSQTKLLCCTPLLLTLPSMNTRGTLRPPVSSAAGSGVGRLASSQTGAAGDQWAGMQLQLSSRSSTVAERTNRVCVLPSK